MGARANYFFLRVWRLFFRDSTLADERRAFGRICGAPLLRDTLEGYSLGGKIRVYNFHLTSRRATRTSTSTQHRRNFRAQLEARLGAIHDPPGQMK